MSRDVILEGNILGPSVPEGPGRLTVRGGRVVDVVPGPLAGRPAAVAAGLVEPSPASGGDGPAVVSGARLSHAADDGLLRLPADHVVIPGFVDAHTHLIGLGLEYLRPNCAGAASCAEALARVADWLSAHPGAPDGSPAGPVIAEGWDQSGWADPTAPTRADLDAICADRPLALRRVCGHVAVFNSRALESLGTAHPGLDPESGLALEYLPLTIGRLWPPEGAVMDQALRLDRRRRGAGA